MTFSRAASNGHYRDLRLVSAEGTWELGFCLYATGMRLRMGRAGRPPSVLDFCLGQDGEMYLPILAAVLRRLESVTEEAEATEIDTLFPWAGTRPDLHIHLTALLEA